MAWISQYLFRLNESNDFACQELLVESPEPVGNSLHHVHHCGQRSFRANDRKDKNGTARQPSIKNQVISRLHVCAQFIQVLL